MTLIQRSNVRRVAAGGVVALFLALAPSASAAGDPTFSRTNFATGGQPTSVAVGDLNGDLRPDVVTANHLTSDVSVLLGDAFGGFTGPVEFPTANSAEGLAIADLDNDGSLDLAVANGNSVGVLLGAGLGGFAPAVDFATGTFPLSVAFADFNDDGRRDLVTANDGAANVSVLLGDGAGGFAPAVNHNVGSDPQSVAVGDFNGDGETD
ncbi:MAG: VCBS repeat-containing protein, partial [Solirubrobacteraceae bacterium]